MPRSPSTGRTWFRACGKVLDRAGFNETQIPEHCGVNEKAKLSFGVMDRPRLIWRTRDAGPLSTLIRLFLVGAPVELEALRTGDRSDGSCRLGGARPDPARGNHGSSDGCVTAVWRADHGV